VARPELKISGVSIVLLGQFNPAIFSPAWFSMHDLLPKMVAENANLQIARKELIEFSTEWLELFVTHDRFSASTIVAPHVRVRDLVVRVFGEHLFHTPVTAFGINRQLHFDVGSNESREHIGRALAPTEPWGEIADLLHLNEEQNGMVSLVMRQNNPLGRSLGGQINIHVEPSNQIGDGKTGVYVEVNDHYSSGTAESGEEINLIEFLGKEYENSIRQADKIADHLISLATVS